MDDVTKEEIIKEAIENAKKENKKAKKENTKERPAGESLQDETDNAPQSKAEAGQEEEPSEEEKTDGEEAAGEKAKGADAGAAEESAETGETAEKKTGFFQKKNKSDKYKEQIAELEDKVKRQLAEFENFRNRTEKEKSQMYDMGAKSVLEKILPVIDNFERGLATVPETEAGSGFAEGMNMIYKQLLTELEKIGVSPIEAVGKEFDPNLHNAVMQVESEEFESGIVAQEMQKGYMYRDTVLRHSMVGVVP